MSQFLIKLLFYFILISFSVTSIVVIITIFWDSEKFKQTIHSDFKRIEKHSLVAFSSIVYEEDQKHVLYLLQEILKNPNFKYVRITENQSTSYELGEILTGPSVLERSKLWPDWRGLKIKELNL